jgi:hypothetical protein
MKIKKALTSYNGVTGGYLLANVSNTLWTSHHGLQLIKQCYEIDSYFNENQENKIYAKM